MKLNLDYVDRPVKRWQVLVLAFVLLTSGGPATAADGWYVSGNLGATRLRDWDVSAIIDLFSVQIA